jgi:RNA-directed DNA polymerase
MKAEADRADQARAEDIERNSMAAAARAEADVPTRARTKAEVATTGLMEAVVERGNLRLAYQPVVENKGAAGVDELTVSELKDHLKRHWPTIRARLLAGDYWPMAVRRVDIPKPQGGMRTLGIPTVVDRLIQQALHQVLQPIFEPTFSEGSYGFRPGRSAHQALRRAQQSGAAWLGGLLQAGRDQVGSGRARWMGYGISYAASCGDNGSGPTRGRAI